VLPVPGDSVPRSTSVVPESLLITEDGVGGFRLGSTLAAVRRELPGATFARTSDAEGAALVEVVLGGGESLILYAGEEDAGAPIDWSRPIEVIEVFRPPFATADGIHPHSPVTEVERTWGKVRRIVRSEIEARQFVEFERQPAWITLRLDYTGRFPEDSSVTTEFHPSARILSIAVSRFGMN